MISRRTAVGIIASASTIGMPGIGLAAKEKHHFNGQALLGDKIKQNGKHKIHKVGNADVFAEVNNGKVVGMSAAGMQVKKVKSSQKLAQTTPGLILASMQLAQTLTYYYGYWVYDPVFDYYYWYPAELVIVHASWVPYQEPPHWPNDDIRSRRLVLLSRGTRRPRRWLWRGLPKPHPGTPGAWLSGWLRAAHAFESGAKRRQWGVAKAMHASHLSTCE